MNDSSLPVEFQSELYLSRVVGRVARRGNPAEIGAFKIQGAGSADHGRSARGSLGSGEVRVIGKVKKFGSELEPGLLRGPKLLENREVEPVKPRTKYLAARASKRGQVGLPV